jgi:hypothetical protein
MPLRFSDDPARYNPYTDVVTFFAMDGEIMVMCTISRESIEYLESTAGLTGVEILAGFARHRTKIRQRATVQHRVQERRVTCVLCKAHFVTEAGEP